MLTIILYISVKFVKVRFPVSYGYLNTIRAYCENKQLSVHVSKIEAFSNEAVQNAFSEIMSRRTVGKIALQFTPSTK